MGTVVSMVMASWRKVQAFTESNHTSFEYFKSKICKNSIGCLWVTIKMAIKEIYRHVKKMTRLVYIFKGSISSCLLNKMENAYSYPFTVNDENKGSEEWKATSMELEGEGKWCHCHVTNLPKRRIQDTTWLIWDMHQSSICTLKSMKFGKSDNEQSDTLTWQEVLLTEREEQMERTMITSPKAHSTHTLLKHHISLSEHPFK